jgi:hypothetical protein
MMDLALAQSRRRVLASHSEHDPLGVIPDAQNAIYRGRLINFLSGLSGVSRGGQAIVNIPVNQRVHEIDFQCTDYNYTGAAVVPTIVTAGGFTNTTGTCLVVVSAQGVVSITYTAGNSAGASISTVLQVPDPTGPPITLKCTAAGTGALGNATFAISGAAPGPIDPRVLITSVKISVNGQNLRDITPTQIQAIAAARGYVSDFGTLSLFFTEPWQNFLRDNAMLSWDLFGQNTFSIQLGIASTATTSCSINGSIVFDGNRNTRKASATDVSHGVTVTNSSGVKVAVTAGQRIPFLQPCTQHAFSVTLAAGKNDITTLPISFRQRALWILGATPGNIYQVELLCDGTKIFEATSQQMFSVAAKYGIQLGNVFVAPTQGGGYGSATMGNGSTSGQPLGGNLVPTTTPNGALLAANAGNQGAFGANGVFPFDAAWIADLDGRPWESLLAQQSLILRLYSNVSQNCTIIQEAFPGGYVS